MNSKEELEMQQSKEFQDEVADHRKKNEGNYPLTTSKDVWNEKT